MKENSSPNSKCGEPTLRIEQKQEEDICDNVNRNESVIALSKDHIPPSDDINHQIHTTKQKNDEEVRDATKLDEEDIGDNENRNESVMASSKDHIPPSDDNNHLIPMDNYEMTATDGSDSEEEDDGDDIRKADKRVRMGIKFFSPALQIVAIQQIE
jgi:hypothetical protein